MTAAHRTPKFPPLRTNPEPVPMPDEKRTHLMAEADVRRAIARMAREIVERNGGTDDLVLMGIHRRGTTIAAWLRSEIESAEGVRLPFGSVDITLYRDDLAEIGPRPVVGGSELPPEGIDDRTVVIVDDVAYTGRTGRAALNEVTDWGRPRRILLCVLIDRGGRELPIQPDIVGRTFQVLSHQRVEVMVPEIDGRMGVELVDPVGAS